MILSTLYIEDTNKTVWKLGKTGETKIVHLRSKFFDRGLNIPKMSKIDLEHPHANNTRLPINTLLDYMTSSRAFYEKLTDMESTSEGVGDALQKKAKEVENLVESTVWGPIKKYAKIIGGCLVGIVILWIAYKMYGRRNSRKFAAPTTRRQLVDEHGQKVEVVYLMPSQTRKEELV